MSETLRHTPVTMEFFVHCDNCPLKIDPENTKANPACPINKVIQAVGKNPTTATFENALSTIDTPLFQSPDIGRDKLKEWRYYICPKAIVSNDNVLKGGVLIAVEESEPQKIPDYLLTG